MRSMLQALVWDSLRYTNWIHVFMLAICVMPLLVYGTLSGMNTADGLKAGDPIMLLLEVSLLPFVIFILLLAAGNCHTNNEHLFLKPISNLSISAWRMLGGAVLLAIEVGGVVALYNGLYRVGWPLVGAMLFAVATWFTAQPFLMLAGRSVWNTLITVVPMFCMAAWFIMRYKPIGGGTTDWNEISVSETLQLLGVIGLFTWLGTRSVPVARRGDSLAIPAWLSKLGNAILSWDLRPRADKPFRSPRQAMFWYEWRLKGWTLTVCLLAFSGITVTTGLANEFSLASLFNALLAAFLGMLLPTCLVGMLNGLQLDGVGISLRDSAKAKMRIDQLGSFQSTRPVTNTQLAHANLWMCLASIGLLVGVWLLMAVPILIAAGQYGVLKPILHDKPQTLIPGCTLALWIIMSNLVSLMSTGRTKLIGGLFLTICLAFTVLTSSLEWFGKGSSRHLLEWTFAVASLAALVCLTLWAYQKALREKLLTAGAVSIAGCIGLAIGLLNLALSPDRSPQFVLLSIAVGILSILPWATTPLAIAWNRHR